MFIFDIRDDDDVSLDDVCGSSLKKVLNNICGDLRKTSCLQIQEPHASGIPSYYHYCLRYLSYGVQSSGKAKRIILLNNHDPIGKLYDQPIVAITKQLVAQLDTLEKKTLAAFIKKVKPIVKFAVIQKYAPEIAAWFAQEPLVIPDNIHRSDLSNQLMKLIECVCMELSTVVIANINTDQIRSSYKQSRIQP